MSRDAAERGRKIVESGVYAPRPAQDPYADEPQDGDDHHVAEPNPNADVRVEPDSDAELDPDAGFWSQRTILEHIRDFAYSRSAAPFATLACRGPDASTWWAKLRDECHQLAVETGADDERLRASLAVIALSEARERGQELRVDQLTAMYSEELGDDMLGCVGAQLAGQVLAARYGDALDGLFVRMKRYFGIGGAA